jgi:hypothetical protein
MRAIRGAISAIHLSFDEFEFRYLRFNLAV